MVTYKETVDDAKTDPSGEWTGTWRDPRFQCCGLGGCLGCPGPSNSGQPENALSGTIFTANQILANQVNFATDINVSSDYSALRFWRNTEVADLLSGQSLNVGDYVLGYEFDEDLDNGFRPAGLVPLSSTTLEIAQKLQDYGATFGPGIVTHAMTMYRAESGALVFGAGTVQYAWGLDNGHDGQNAATDRNLQQATINLFADMGVQPTTLMAGLVPATASTDAIAPVSTITSPIAGSVVNPNNSLTITGTAQDFGGGVVAVVEISVDGGHSWHRANGTQNWAYSFTPRSAGEFTILTRAVDDSLNIEQNSPQVTVNPSQTPGTYTLWPGSAVPETDDSLDDNSTEVGVKFTSDVDGYVTGIRFYKSEANTGVHVGNLWTVNGDLLATATFTNETSEGWQQVDFNVPVAINAGELYIASYFAPNGHYADDFEYFAEFGITNGPLHAPREGALGSNGFYVYSDSSAFPTSTYRSANNWVDVVLSTTVQADTTAPTVTSVTPTNGATDVATTVAPKIVFSEAMDATTINASTVRLLNGASTVAATVSYNAATRTATLTPTAPLGNLTDYTLSVSTGVKDLAGNALAQTFTSDFITAIFVEPEQTETSTLWSNSTSPSVVDVNEPDSLELGVRFTANVDGYVTGIRFYKSSGNTGTHVGHLWTSSGQLLATATFTGESNSGWQQVLLSTPVAITAGTTYVASYFAPNGNFSVDRNYFNSSYANGLLSVPTGGGVFRYGNSSGFPSQSYNNSNYWVDVLVETTPPVDATAPTVTSVTPTSGATGVATTVAPQIVFSEAMDAATINSTTVRLLNGGSTVAATVSYNAATRTATLTPTSVLANSTTYTVSVSTGVEDLAGNVLAQTFTANFATVAAPPVDTTAPTVTSVTPTNGATDVATTVAPKVVFSEAMDAATINATTVRLLNGASTVAASVSYNAATRTVTLTPTSVLANSTTYTVSVSTGVEDLAGNVLAQTFTANFATVAAPPVDTTAPTVTSVTPTNGATDVATTVAPQIVFSEAMDAATINATTVRLLDGGSTVAATVSYNAATRTATLTPTASLSNLKTYTVSVTGGVKDLAGNALAQAFTANFTVIALPTDITAPTVTNVNPANGATDVATSIAPQVTFSEAMDAATINGNTVRLLNENGSVIGASVTYNAATRRVTITPYAALSTLQYYTVSIVGGANGVKDLAGNSLAQNSTSGFTTTRPTLPRARR